MTPSNSAPKWLKIVAAIAVIWNTLGVLAFVGQIMISPATLAQMPVAEQDLIKNTPLWATIAFAIAVFCGLLGAIALYLQRKLSKLWFIVSLIGILIQDFYAFVVVDSIAVYGTESLMMPLLVLIIAIVLIAIAHNSEKSHWLS